MSGMTWDRIDRAVDLARKVRHWKRCEWGGCERCFKACFSGCHPSLSSVVVP